jgi:type I restriction enzyme M protein
LTASPYINPEQSARQQIDEQLLAAGWLVQDYRQFKPVAGLGIAVRKLWIYDLRTNQHFTLKERTLKRSDLDEFVACYNTKDRTSRKESERFKSFTYEQLAKRDKVNLDIFWLKDEALEESANLPAPEVIAADITADLEAALEQFAAIAEDLK